MPEISLPRNDNSIRVYQEIRVLQIGNRGKQMARGREKFRSAWNNGWLRELEIERLETSFSKEAKRDARSV
ncbi:hypothetical protein QQG55_36435 [Brugia pahangi]|uniref:Uncharacterized protein n=1 Tax=Brugia pahangi TaxID=6280 RepID=A0A0N4TXC6_BRUPA|nr:unnamed protein product [Brugia pahangi]